MVHTAPLAVIGKITGVQDSGGHHCKGPLRFTLRCAKSPGTTASVSNEAVAISSTAATLSIPISFPVPVP